jgi:predicted amidohydrolase
LPNFWDERILDALNRGLGDPDKAVRRAAILGIKELGDERFLPALADAASRETDPGLHDLLESAPESLIPAPGPHASGPEAPKVKVAAVQFLSELNAPTHNRKRLEGLVREAANQGAKVVVLPETAITGYMSVDLKTTWQLDGRRLTEGLRGIPPSSAAETVPGPSTEAFARLAGELGIYLTIPFLEHDPGTGKYFNTVVLAGPEGTALLHYRKLNPWPFAERGWASEGDRGHQWTDTPYGRLGLLICYDINRQPPHLKEANVDALLYCIAWVDREKSTWFHAELPRIARQNDLNIIGANWTVPKRQTWHGYGQSLIIHRTGQVLARASKDIGEEIVYAELPIAEKTIAGEN